MWLHIISRDRTLFYPAAHFDKNMRPRKITCGRVKCAAAYYNERQHSILRDRTLLYDKLLYEYDFYLIRTVVTILISILLSRNYKSELNFLKAQSFAAGWTIIIQADCLFCASWIMFRRLKNYSAAWTNISPVGHSFRLMNDCSAWLFRRPIHSRIVTLIPRNDVKQFEKNSLFA